MIADATHHARMRCQQRGVPPLVVEFLHRFGSSSRCGGAERLFFDKSAKQRLKAYLGGDRSMRCIDRWLNVYVVVGDDGYLRTVGRKTKRFRRFN